MIQQYLVYILYGYLGLMLFAHNPIIPIIRILTLPIKNKWPAIRCMIGAWVRSLLIIIPDMMAPIIVPIALIFTKWEDDKLPWVFRWWDNDASINGDVRTDDPNDGMSGWALKAVPSDDTEEARGMCYWAVGSHPRSFKARYVWLGLRNRASMLSVMLGKNPSGVVIEYAEGDPTSPIYSGWKVTRIDDTWRWFETIKVGPIFFRFHYGYKIPKIPTAGSAVVTAIAFSFQKVK